MTDTAATPADVDDTEVMTPPPVNEDAMLPGMPPPPPPADPPDPEAPYGRTASGAARRKPGRKRGKGATATAPAAGSSRPAGRSRGRPARSSGPDYRSVIGGLIQMVILPLSMIRDNRAVATAAVVADGCGPIVEAGHNLAVESPPVAAVLDRLAKVGPYGELITAITPVAMAVAFIWGAVPSELGRQMGMQSADEIVGELHRQAAADAGPQTPPPPNGSAPPPPPMAGVGSVM